MRPVFTMTLLIHLFNLIEIVFGSTYYKQEKTKILQDSVIKRWTNKSAISCLLQCHANKDCKLAAIQESDCLSLNVTEPNGDRINNDEKELFPVTLLRFIKGSIIYCHAF